MYFYIYAKGVVAACKTVRAITSKIDKFFCITI